jgi:hypothetical protein
MKMAKIDLISEQELLATRLCDLEINLKATPLMRGINQLFFELNEKLINFHPHIWLADDWFSPDGVAGFALPFYLTHPRLVELEKKHVGLVEGTTFNTFMKLLRHETAHALDNAFHLRKNKQRQNLFGLSSKKYPKTYLPNPKSKNFVRHLEDFYAQAHPDEDWAETFAVWLNPKSEWEYKYAFWEAIEKLEFVDKLMAKLPKQKCFRKNEFTSIKEDTRTLREYYRDKKRDLRLNNKRPVIQKIDTEYLPYVVNNKKEVRKILLKQKGVNSYIIDKFLKDVGNECKSKKIQLNYNSQVSIAILEQQLQAATQEYLKQGRHRIVM